MQSNSFRLTYSEEFLRYSLGPTHPMNPTRIAASMSLMNYLLADNEDFTLIGPSIVDPSVLELAHSKPYIDALSSLSNPSENQSSDLEMDAFLKFGIGTSDCPVFDHMAEISELIVGSTVSAAEAIMNDEFHKGFVMLAGLHHASQDRASGFCYYNDINVAIQHIKNQNADTKILYIDTDLHAGDGVSYHFYNDPKVLTMSFHESGKYLFPGTCFSNEIGSQEGKGYSVNLPLAPLTHHDLYIDAFNKYLPVFVEDFQPDIIIWQAGVDGHADDPLGHLMLTTQTYASLGKQINKEAEKMDTPRVLALGGGGYNPISVAKSWYAEVAALANVNPIIKSPQTWIDEVKNQWGIEMPSNLIDGKRLPENEFKDSVHKEFDHAIEEFEKHLQVYWSV